MVVNLEDAANPYEHPPGGAVGGVVVGVVVGASTRPVNRSVWRLSAV